MSASLPRTDGWPVLGTIARWWRRRRRARSTVAEFESWGRADFERMAQDIGVSASDLRLLLSCGPDEADLLQRRMAILQLDSGELARAEPATLRDLQKLCAMCRSRRRCARDLARECDDPAWRNWQDYCPNAATLNMLSTLQIRSDGHR